jgi:hypothetical protein
MENQLNEISQLFISDRLLEAGRKIKELGKK